jgi:tryptophanyl-tRNA synthetase
MNTDKKTRLSGIQPTGNLHLGNYLGAMKPALDTQDQYKNLFFIADLHSITANQDPEKLTENTLSIAALYLASGLDTKYSTLFIQSHISSHAELAYLLSCITPLSKLQRMTQFKEKSKLHEETSTGLLNYPILMAADILLYQADLIPCGEDQKQHIELTRYIAKNFNNKFQATFNIPSALIAKNGARIMSLDDASKKMSKSNPSDFSRINLLDSPELIRQKIKKAKTDSIHGLTFDDPNRPESHNLLTIYMLMTGRSKEDIAQECKEISYREFKSLLAEAIISHLEPIQRRYQQLRSDESKLISILTMGATYAGAIAEKTLQSTKNALGYLPRANLC